MTPKEKAIFIELIWAARPFTSGDVVVEVTNTKPLLERLEKAIEDAWEVFDLFHEPENGYFSDSVDSNWGKMIYENEKVFCGTCKWLFKLDDYFCHHPNNIKDTWLSPDCLPSMLPSERNKNNDCDWYEKK